MKAKYCGENWWGYPLYKIGKKYAVLLSEDLYWCTPFDDPDGEPGFPVRNVEIQKPKTESQKTMEEKMFIIASMIAANQYHEGRSVEWLDLASGINNLKETKKILEYLQKTPMHLIFCSGYGWVTPEQAKSIENLEKYHFNLQDRSFCYGMLDRLRSDCEYFLSIGSERVLWAKGIEEHICIMQDLYNIFFKCEKPKWISLEEIKDLRDKMILRKNL